MKNEPKKIYLSLKVSLVFLIIGFILVASILGYSYYTGIRMSNYYTPLIDATMEIKLETTISHLWFEEIISRDKTEDINKVFTHLDQAAWYINSMMHGGENTEGNFLAIDSSEIVDALNLILTKLNNFKELTELRYLCIIESKAGSEIDQQYDKIYRQIIDETDLIETQLQNLINRDIIRFKIVQGFLFLILVLFALFTGILFYRFINSRIQFYEEIRKVNTQLLNEVGIRKQTEEKLKTLNDRLEQEVTERTKDLQDKVDQLESFHDATVQREFRMEELRREIAELKKNADKS